MPPASKLALVDRAHHPACRSHASDASS